MVAANRKGHRMAHRYSRSGRYKKRQWFHHLYLAVAVIGCGAVIYFLFRGGPSGPQDANAGGRETESASPSGKTTPSVVAQTAPEKASVDREMPLQVPLAVPRQPVEPAPKPNPPAKESPALVAESAVVAQADSAQTGAVLAEVKAMLSSDPGKIIAARDKLNEALASPMPPDQRDPIKKEMALLSEKWLFGPVTFPTDELCDNYTVKPGDLLEVIGRRFKVPYEILMQINNIPRPESLAAGRTIKIIKGPFHAKVYRSTFTLDLYLRDTYVRSFKVGLGRPGHDTPTGLWRVQEGGKLIKPTWTDPDTQRVYRGTDPDYPLGSRWIALDGIEGSAKDRTGFAIHGTKAPDEIGHATSRGCIRMYNGEAILVYNLLFPLYSKVEVMD